MNRINEISRRSTDITREIITGSKLKLNLILTEDYHRNNNVKRLKIYTDLL